MQQNGRYDDHRYKLAIVIENVKIANDKFSLYIVTNGILSFTQSRKDQF